MGAEQLTPFSSKKKKKKKIQNDLPGLTANEWKASSFDLLGSAPMPRPVTIFIRTLCQRGQSQLSVMDYELTFHLAVLFPGAALAVKDLFKNVSGHIKAQLLGTPSLATSVQLQSFLL